MSRVPFTGDYVKCGKIFYKVISVTVYDNRIVLLLNKKGHDSIHYVPVSKVSIKGTFFSCKKEDFI